MTASRGRARVGVLVPFTNTNLEPDLALMAPPGLSLHVARMGGYDADLVPDEHQMRGLGAADLEEPLRLLAGVAPDMVVYGCTSATLTHGPAFDRALADRIAAGSGAGTVTAAGAVVAALKALGVRRIGFASPYVAAINDMAVRFLEECGVDTLRRFEVDRALSNAEQGALTPGDVFGFGMAADHPKAQAVVLSCTDMRSVEAIARLETELGKPVVTSNQAILFAMLRGLGIDDTIDGFGQLLRRRRS